MGGVRGSHTYVIGGSGKVKRKPTPLIEACNSYGFEPYRERMSSKHMARG